MNNYRIRIEFKRSCLKQDKVTFNPNSLINLFLVYELNRWSKGLNADFTLKYCLFGDVKLVENDDPVKYCYSSEGTKFDSRSLFLFLGFDWGKNVIISGVDNSSFVHIDNKKKVLVEGRTWKLDEAAEATL